MGNGASINVILDHKGVIQAGSVLKGRVVVKVTSSPVRAEKVMIRLYGKEKIWVWVRDERVVTEKTLLTKTLTVAQFCGRNSLHPGTYSFPFSSQLPSWLPSSTEYMNVDDSAGFRIRYKIQCRMGRKLRTSACFTVASSASSPPGDDNGPQPALIMPTAFPIESSLLTSARVVVGGLGRSTNVARSTANKGSVTLAARAEDTRICKGEVLEVHLACRNDSSVNIRRVEIKLIEHLGWKEQSLESTTARRQPVDGPGEHHETLLHQDDLYLPGLHKQRTETLHGSLSLTPSRRQQLLTTDQEAILDDLVSGDNKVLLKIPSRARDSYTGHLVRIRHALEITAHTDGKTVNKPVIRIPIRVVGSSLSQSLPGSAIAVATPVRLVSFPLGRGSTTPDVIAPAELQDSIRVRDDAAAPIVLVDAIPANEDDHNEDESSEVSVDDAHIIKLGRDAFVGIARGGGGCGNGCATALVAASRYPPATE